MIQGIVFDKDGTLFDFQATWGHWAQGVLLGLADGDAKRAAKMGKAIGYNMADASFVPGSVVIAGTPREIAAEVLPFVKDATLAGLVANMNAQAAMAPQVESVPLKAYFAQLRGLGLKIGVATNDSEAPARAHLAKADVLEDLDFVVGSDSGYGGKPEAGQLAGFCETLRLQPEACLMVGDSLHDLIAGRAAGFGCIAVLTGPAGRADLEDHADVVLNHIGEIPAYLDSLAHPNR